MYYPVASVWIFIYLTLHLVFQPYNHSYITISMLVAVLKFYLDYVIHSELVAMKFNQNIIAMEDTLLLHVVLMVSFILFFLSVLVFHCA